MGSDRDHFVLTTRRNRRFIQSAETYPVVKVRFTPKSEPPDEPAEAEPSPSDPLVGGLPRKGRTRINGSKRDLIPEGWSSCFGDGTRTVRLCLVGACSSGGDEETRTPDPLLAKEMLCQLSYVPSLLEREMVGVSGLEPETSALSGQCSNQLS